MSLQSTIVYADFENVDPYPSSAVAESIAQAARDSLIAGRFNFGLKALSGSEIQCAVQEFSSSHDRLSLDNNLILLDAGAMLAYAPYRTTILLSNDPFGGVERMQDSLGLSADLIRLRLHDALLASSKVISLSRSAYEALLPILPIAPERRAIPSTVLRAGGDAVLVVGNLEEVSSQDILDSLRDTFPEQEFVAFDASIPFHRPWKLVLQVGIARSSFPGARLTDAWAGGLPLLQFVDATSLGMQRRRRPKQLEGGVVEHGKTGLLCSTEHQLKALLGELLYDILPARAVARGAKARADPAGEWDDLLKAVLQ